MRDGSNRELELDWFLSLFETRTGTAEGHPVSVSEIFGEPVPIITAAEAMEEGNGHCAQISGQIPKDDAISILAGLYPSDRGQRSREILAACNANEGQRDECPNPGANPDDWIFGFVPSHPLEISKPTEVARYAITQVTQRLESYFRNQLKPDKRLKKKQRALDIRRTWKNPLPPTLPFREWLGIAMEAGWTPPWLSHLPVDGIFLELRGYLGASNRQKHGLRINPKAPPAVTDDDKFLDSDEVRDFYDHNRNDVKNSAEFLKLAAAHPWAGWKGDLPEKQMVLRLKKWNTETDNPWPKGRPPKADKSSEKR